MTRETDAVHTKLARQVGGAIACLLAAALLLGLTACGGGLDRQQQAEPPAVVADEPEEPPLEAPEPEEPDPEPVPEPPVDGDEEEHDGFPEPEDDDDPQPVAVNSEFTQEEFDEQVSKVLDSIIKDDMTPLKQAKAVFDYVHNNVRYTGHSDKSDWVKGAYTGLTTKKGDCFTYYAVSRALLDALEIDNLEVERVGGTTQHFWNLVNCGDGWYHFDTCPRSLKMPSFNSFMVTDQQIADFTAMAGRHYYDFDDTGLPERATEIITNTRPIPRPVEPEEEPEEDPNAEDPNAENPDAENPDAENPGEPQLPPDEVPQDQTDPGAEPPMEDSDNPENPGAGLPSDQDGPALDPAVSDGAGEDEPSDTWTELPAESSPEPELDGGEPADTGGEAGTDSGPEMEAA